MKLNIYEKRKVVKTYEASTYDLPFGIMEDVAGLIDVDALKDASDMDILKAVGAVAMQSMDLVKELLHDIFPEITDEEIRKTTVTEIAGLIVDIVKYTINLLARGATEKNLMSR